MKTTQNKNGGQGANHSQEKKYKSFINVSDEGLLTDLFLDLRDQEESLQNWKFNSLQEWDKSIYSDYSEFDNFLGSHYDRYYTDPYRLTI
jgi:hypothetical protein